MGVNVSAMQWTSLSHIEDVAPIGDADEPVLAEVRNVLAKHNCLERFGITLLHNHFDLSDNELMMETTDLTKREHVVRPMTNDELREAGITAQSTVIAFNETGYRQRCGCDPRASGHHHK